MSGRPTTYTTEIADRILDQLDGGRTLTDVCNDDGMPSPGTVRQWAMDNREGFAARFRQARDNGHLKNGRPTLYTAELAERIFKGMELGRSLLDICSDDGMPDSSTVRRWERENREGFAARYAQARDIGNQATRDEMRQIADEASNENLAVAKLRIAVRQAELSNMQPRIQGSRVNPNARPDVSDALAAMMKAIDGWSRGLPSADPAPMPLLTLTLKDDSDDSDGR